MLSFNRFFTASLILICCVFISHSQTGDTLWVPVIFYDYHADGSNPNFEKSPVDTVGSRAYGMVQDNLSADKKPLLNNDILYNDRIEEWYRPSGADGATFDYVNNRWNGLTELTDGEYVGQNYDPSYDMATIVIYDSLPFIKDPTNPNIFYFDDQDFFPLDGKGFGNEEIDGNGNARNFSFAMELHWEFTYEPGLYFEFQGDDDVWAFINGQLVMDIGGIHGATSDEFYLDSIAESLGLVEGNTYSLDFFYAERHVVQSTIRITNNIISDPDRLVLSVNDTTIQAGQSIDISAQVRDKENQVMVNLLDSISWRLLTDFDNDNITGVQTVLNPDSASKATFTGTLAHDSTMIEATVVFGEDTLRDTAYVSIVPGPLAQIILEHEDGTAMPDDTTLAPGDALTIVAAGYDAYGNRRGMGELGEPSNWTFSGNLHSVDNTEGETQIYYTVDPNDTTVDENGKIRATGVANPEAYDEMNVSIKRSAKLAYAVSRDMNADGYLDAVELHFSQNVLIQDPNKIEVQYDYSSKERIYFDISSISPSDSATVFTVYFDQDSSYDVGQTGWRPYITLNGVEGVSDTIDLLAVDGAGPVIWSVVKEIKSPNDRSKDKVTVTFSEDIIDTSGNNLSSSYYTPEMLFHVWDGSDNTENCDTILNGITNTSHRSDKIEFTWENYKEVGDPVLTANHYFTIDSSMNLITDPGENFPDSDNKRTKVIVMGQTGDMIIGPNPFVPSVGLKDTLEDEDGRLRAFPVNQAEDIEKTEGGTIVKFSLSIPTYGTKDGNKVKIDLRNGDVEIKSNIVVFDAIGNLTYSSENNSNIIETDRDRTDSDWQSIFDNHDAGVSIELAYLWHGLTADGRMAAPGIYRVVVFLNVQYDADKFDDNSFVRKFTDNVGVRR